MKIISDDLLYIREKYGDVRRSQIDQSGDPDFDELDLIPKRDLVVTMSRDGYVKSQLLSDYRAQIRGGKGNNSGKLRDQDAGAQLIVASTHDHILCFTNLGRLYLIDHAFRVPSGSASAKGRPIQNFVSLQQYEQDDGKGGKEKVLERVTKILPIPTPDDTHCVFFSTARAPVRAQLLRLARNEVKLGEVPLEVREQVRASVKADIEELAGMTQEAWGAVYANALPNRVQAKLKELARWDSGEGEESGTEQKGTKTWSQIQMADLPEEVRTQAKALFEASLSDLAAQRGPEWDAETLGDLPESSRSLAREAFRTSLLSDFARTHYVFFATQNGVVKKVPLTEFSKIQAAGTAALSLDSGDVLVGVDLTDGNHSVMLFSDAGKAVRFDENDVRAMGRAARGVGGMKLKPGDKVIALLVANDDEGKMVLTACENGYGKRTEIAEYTLHGRNTQGIIAIGTSERNGRVVGACLVGEEDDVILLSRKGKLVRTPVKDIRKCSRGAQGVKLIDVDTDDNALVSLTPVTDQGEGDAEAEAVPGAPESAPGAEEPSGS